MPLKNHSGGNADSAGRRLAAFHAPLVHAHAVSDLLAGGVHGLPVAGAADVAEAGPADHAAGRFLRMIDGWKDAPIGRGVVGLIVIDGVGGEVLFDGLRKRGAGTERRLREFPNGFVGAQEADGFRCRHGRSAGRRGR